MTSNIERARQNELEALMALVAVGYLTTRQLGEWVYPKSCERDKLGLALRLTRRLETSGHIAKKHTVRGAAAWVLTKTGAFRVRSETDLPAEPGTGLSTGGCNARHLYAVDYLTKARARGDQVIGKAGLRTGISDYSALKGLDGVVIDHETGAAYGLMGVTNRHEENVEKYKRLKEHLPIQLLGERWAVDEVKRRAAQG